MRCIRIGSQAVLDDRSFLFGEKLCRGWVVMHETIRRNRDHDCGKTLQDENPVPSVRPDDTFHKADAIGKDSTKRASQGRGAEEQRDTKLSFTSLVPHRKVVNNPGEEPRLGDTEEEARYEESSEI